MFVTFQYLAVKAIVPTILFGQDTHLFLQSASVNSILPTDNNRVDTHGALDPGTDLSSENSLTNTHDYSGGTGTPGPDALDQTGNSSTTSDPGGDPGALINSNVDINLDGTNVDASLSTNLDVGTNVDASLSTNLDANLGVDTSIDSDLNANLDVGADLNTNLDTGTNVDANLNTNLDTGACVDANLNTNLDTGTNVNSNTSVDLSGVQLP